MNRSLAWVDWLALAYLGSTSLILAFGGEATWGHWAAAGGHLVMAAGIWGFRRSRSLPALLRGSRVMYPLGLLLLLYAEADLYVRILHDPPHYDALVRSWEAALLGGHPHLFLSQWLSGQGWRELFHAFYLSYFLLLSGGFVLVRKRRPAQYPRFAFVVLGMFLSYVGCFVGFPVAGPLGGPNVSPMTTGWFPQVVAWLYVPLRTDGISTGAFPSSHVGMSVGIVCLLWPKRWTVRFGLCVLVVGIAVSTVYGRFHYAIDVVAGVITGGVFYLGWTRLYTLVAGSVSSKGMGHRTGRVATPASETVESSLEQ